MIDTWEDWLEDGKDIRNHFEPPSHAQWMGEQALPIALHAGSAGARGRIIFKKQFDFHEGEPLHVFVPEKVHYMAPTGDGSFALRQSPKSAGLEFAATPRLSPQGSYVSLAFNLTRICSIRDKIPGTALEVGAPSFSKLVFDCGSRMIPLGATLLFELPRGDGHCTVFLFHVASVTDEQKCTLQNCIERLIQNPSDRGARSQFPALLKVSDDETMATMRAHHRTGKTMMLHYYPSHRWIHPFLKGYQLVLDGRFGEAQSEYEAARAAATETPSNGLAKVIAHECRIRLEELSQWLK